MKGVVISSGTSAQMAADFRLFSDALVVHAAIKGYKRWPGVLENTELLAPDLFVIKTPDKNNYATILTTTVTVTGSTNIKKQE